MLIDPTELKQWVGLFLGQFSPAVDGNYRKPMSIIADCHIRAFANYIATLPNDAAETEHPIILQVEAANFTSAPVQPVALSKWYVVCNDDCSYEGDERDAEAVWTLSKNPTEEGWRTDSGYPGYGLTRADAEELANAANSTKRESGNVELIAALQDAVHFIRTRHNMGRVVREERRLAVLKIAQHALSDIEVGDSK